MGLLPGIPSRRQGKKRIDDPAQEAQRRSEGAYAFWPQESVEIQTQRTERIQDRAEYIRESGAQLVAGAHKSLAVILPIVKELEQLFKKAGFREISLVHTYGYCSLVSGRKP
jgi:hypothetical protein